MKQKGFSMIEVVIFMAILAILVMGYTLTMTTNEASSAHMHARDVRLATAKSLLENINAQSFGAVNTDEPLMEQVDGALFGLPMPEGMKPATLSQLRLKSPLTFKVAGIETKGRWAIIIDNDLDGNGVIEEEFTREGRDDLLRIEIQHEGKTVLRTMRTRMPNEVTDGN